jgi:hypothetical protein
LLRQRAFGRVVFFQLAVESGFHGGGQLSLVIEDHLVERFVRLELNRKRLARPQILPTACGLALIPGTRNHLPTVNQSRSLGR